MPFEVNLSAIGGRVDEFRVAVETHAARLTAFGKEIGKPRPVAAAIVEASIKRIQTPKQADTYEADYIIVDDTPPKIEPITLEEKKNQWHSKVYAAEAAAKDLILSPRKRRLAEMKYNTAIHKKVEDQSDEDKASVAFFIEANKQWAAVGLQAAYAESAIDDLTEDNVNSWEVPKFGAE